jgi:hypothetical protein
MEPYIQIPKTASSTVDTSAPSFLTSLPPELRNGIYKVLFRYDKPVLVHNADSYHAREPERAESTDQTSFMLEMGQFEQVYEAEIGGDDELNFGFHLGIPTLHSCRQIYHESVEVLEVKLPFKSPCHLGSMALVTRNRQR